MDVFKHPMCLISTETVKDAKGEIININYNGEQEVLNQIKQIDLPMVIVAVVGLYRTGKSYLMNCLAESSKGIYKYIILRTTFIFLKVTDLISMNLRDTSN